MLKVTKPLVFSVFRNADLIHNFNTTIANEITVIIDKLYLYVQIFVRNAETQLMVNDSVKNSLTSSFASWLTDRKNNDTEIEYQIVIGSSEFVYSPKYLKVPQQSAARTGVSRKQYRNFR